MFKDTDKFNGQMCVFVNFERIFLYNHVLVKVNMYDVLYISFNKGTYTLFVINKNVGCFDFSTIDLQSHKYVNVKKLRI